MKIASGKKDLSVFDLLGRGPLPQHKKTCAYWLKGKCTRRRCPYMHAASSAAPKTKQFLSPQVKQPLSNHLVPSNANISKRLTNTTWTNADTKKPIGGNVLRGSPKQQSQEEPPRRLIRTIATNDAKDPISSDLVQSQKEETSGKEDTTNVTKGSGSGDLIEPLMDETGDKEDAASATKGSVSSDLIKPLKEDTAGSSTEDTEPRKRTSPVKEGSSVSNNKCGLSRGSGLTQLAKLKGHNKTITGIALPCGSTTLYTASNDKCLRAWDCQTGQCTGTECLDGEVRCIVTKGSWLFAGLPNNIKAWNPQDKVKCSLNAIGGQVQSLEFNNDILFAGMENGNILVWRWNHATINFELATTLKGHSGPVQSLVIGSGHGKLYSVSADSSIKVWDQTLHCIQTIDGHSKEVTSLVCWDRYVLTTCSDKTLKIWANAESGSMEMVYKHEVDQGIIAVSLLDKPEARHILLSLEDKSLRLYDFPSFSEKGRVYLEEQPVVSQASSIHGLFLTGDVAGDVSVWELCCRD